MLIPDKTSYRKLTVIIAGGLILKLIYVFAAGPILFGNDLFVTNDTVSYTDSFLYLLKTGTYTNIPSHPPAAYGRLPVLPFLWGIFYLIFGFKNSFLAFALFQIVLDAIVILFLFRIFQKLFSAFTAMFVAFAYLLFPLTYYFITKTGTEYLGWVICVWILYQLVFFRPDLKHSALMAFTLCLGFLLRETLLLLVPIVLFYLTKHFSFSLKNFTAGLLIFLILYLPWPVRNYVNHHRFIPIRELSAGYKNYDDDVNAYLYWLYAWHDSDVMDYFHAAYNDTVKMHFPEEVFNNDSEKELAYDLITLARKCGTGFNDWKRIAQLPQNDLKCNRNTLIEGGFNVLKKNYRESHPWVYYIKVPLLNMKKALFRIKPSKSAEAFSWVFFVSMLLRNVMLLIGMRACLTYWPQDFFKIIFVFFIVILLFFCVVLRQVEMRYFFQADLLLWIAAASFIAQKFRKKEILLP